MLVLGITGTLGAGKGTIVEYLQKAFGFNHFSVRSLLIEFIEEQGLEVNRDSMVFVANELRRNNSPSFLVETLYERAKNSEGHCIIESIRTPGEVISLRNKGRFILLAIDADPKLRFERIQSRNSETDKIDFDEFLANEAREMSSADPNHQNLKACIGMADHQFRNDGSINDLQQKVHQVVETLLLHNKRNGETR